MNNIDALIAQLCPDGVEFRELGDLCLSVTAGGDLPENYKKGQVSPSNEYPYPIYSNGCDGNALYGFTDKYKISTEAVTISARGTIGFHTVRKAKFTPIVRLISLIPNKEMITTKFLNYVLDITPIGGTSGSIPQLTVPTVRKIAIPLPPLPIQQEIVNILDKFTSLQAELQVELQVRRAQYEYYRNELLNFEAKEVEWKPLGEVCDNIISGKNALKANEGDYPVYGSTGIIGRSNLYVYENDCLLVARVGANAGFVYKAKGKYDVSDNTLIIRPKEIYNMSFAYFQLLNLGLNKFAVGGGQPLITAGLLKKLKIPLPPLAEQNRIVAILDKFDKLVNDISEGLPAEIQARRKQYEYYRGKLLDFKSA